MYTPLARALTVAAPRKSRRCRICTERTSRYVLIGTLPICRVCYDEKIATVQLRNRIVFARLMVGLPAGG